MSAYAQTIPSQSDYTTCCECGVEFASPVISLRRNDGQSFYCPNGHRQSYTQTEACRLRKELEATKQRLAIEQNDNAWQRSQRQTVEKRLSVQRGLTARAKKNLARIQNGVCPCCNRSFENLRRHMETKHPEAK